MRPDAINERSTLFANYGGMMDLMSWPMKGCVAGTRHENGHGFIGGIE